MPLLIIAFVAGVLTVAAPCILPLLPVVLGRSVAGSINQRRFRALVIISSLAISIIIFSLLLKASTALLAVPPITWQIISGIIITILGLNLLFPQIWGRFVGNSGLYEKVNRWLGTSFQKSSYRGDILVGAALGPVFNSCSPTYALIVATILPAAFLTGLAYLVAYTLGLVIPLALITHFGTKFTAKLGWLSDPNGWFHKLIAVVFIIVGVGIIFGWDKQLQAWIIGQGWYAPLSDLELKLRQ